MKVCHVLITVFIALALIGCQVPSAPPVRSGTVQPDQCPVTPYTRSLPPDENTANYSQTWFGNGVLWAGISPAFSGHWYALPTGFKVLWYRGVPGKLTIEGHLAQPNQQVEALFKADVPDGYGASGFQSSGIYFPQLGCWTVVGRVADQELQFTVDVLPASQSPTG